MLPRNKKMRRDVKLLYDVMADTIGFLQVKMNAASLQLASIHSRSTQCPRDGIINSLRSALREEQVVLQIATGITKCDDYYKVRQKQHPRCFESFFTFAFYS